jgi:hypothetical protein
MAIIAFYASELLPAVGTWSHGQPWRNAVPLLFALSYLVALVAAIWRVVVSQELRWTARLLCFALFFVLPIFGVLGYYWFSVHGTLLGAAEAVALE